MGKRTRRKLRPRGGRWEGRGPRTVQGAGARRAQRRGSGDHDADHAWRNRDDDGALMDALSAAAFGVVLAATAGLRAFLPVFSASLMAWMTDLPLPDNLTWLERPQTVLIFGAATLLEILGDKIPLVDHALDSVQV